jgi:hypothetical protein
LSVIEDFLALMKIESALELTKGCHYGSQRNSNRKDVCHGIPASSSWQRSRSSSSFSALAVLRIATIYNRKAISKMERWRRSWPQGTGWTNAECENLDSAMGQTESWNGASRGARFVSPC